MPLKVLNWNTADGAYSLERVAESIRSEAPDIVLMNEVLSRGN